MLEGGVRGGGFPLRHGCCVQARDKICDPAEGGVLEGGVRESPPPARLLCPSTRQVQQTTGARGGGGVGGVSPPGTAAVSKHEKGIVTKQITGALQFMVAFALRGGGQHLREYISLRCALGGGRSVPEPARL